MIEAMNDMGAIGWELKQTYTAPNGNGTTFYWVVQRTISDSYNPSQEEIKKKFPTKKDLNP